MKKTARRVWFLGALLLGMLFFAACGESPEYAVKILNLAEGEVLQSDSVAINFIVSPEDWQEKGYTVHFMLDRDFLRIKKDLSPVFYTGLTEGPHAVFAMVCNEKGVSLRAPESIDIRNFYYKVRTEPLIKKDLPLLILHQPVERIYRGPEAFHILIDFRVLNAPLGHGYRVHVNLDGEDFYYEEDEPIWTDRASRIGEHDITVTLETDLGNPVLTNPFNQITRHFGVREK